MLLSASVDFSRIKSDRQVKRELEIDVKINDFSRIKSDRQVKQGYKTPANLLHFSRIKSDRQVKLDSLTCLRVTHFSRIKSDKQAKKAKRFYGAQSRQNIRQKALRLSAILHGLHNTGVCG